MQLVSILLFIFSLLLLLWVAVGITTSVARSRRDAFWILAGTVYLQLSSIPLFLSIFHYLNVLGFIACQVCLAFLVLVLKKHRKGSQALFTFKSTRATLSNIERGLLALVILLLLLSFTQRVFTPISSGDVLYYHAPRTLYWIQNASMAPYPTMNDRQTVFAFGSDLIFMWPILFIKSEFIGRMVYWFGFLAAAIGFYTVMRAMRCSKRLSLLGVSAFLSLPIVFNFSTNLQPLVWVTFFALGAGYWALRVSQTSAHNSFFILLLGIYCVLPGNAKNNAVVLIPAGALAVLLVSLCQNVDAKRFRTILKSLATYIFAICIGLLLSGLGFLMVQNRILYGNWLASDLRENQNIAEFSPYQIYVHTIRIGSVLAEIPMPFGNESVEKFGNKLIGWLRADNPLPKEEEWGWVGHYKYDVPKWPTKSFGIAGLFILLIFIAGIVSGGRRLSRKKLSNFLESLKQSEKLPYAIVAFALFLLTAYLLRWITCGTRSFIAPGVVCVLPLALSFLNRKRIPKTVYSLVFISFLIFALLFSIYQGHDLMKRVKRVGFNWSKIAYSQIFKDRDRIIDEYVPKSSTILLLVDGNFKDYSMFGQSYTRQVIQYTGARTKESIYELSKQYPAAFMYISNTTNRNKELLKLLNGVNFVEEVGAGQFVYRAGELTALSSVHSLDDYNLIRNGDFEHWHEEISTSAYFASKFADLVPDGEWLPGGNSPFSISRETVTVKSGNYALKLESNSSGGTRQGLHLPLSPEEYGGKSLILMAWVRSNTKTAEIHIYDRTQLVTATHSGNSRWELLTVGMTVSKFASKLDVFLNSNQGNGTSYFDSVYLLEGELLELSDGRLFRIGNTQDIQDAEEEGK